MSVVVLSTEKPSLVAECRVQQLGDGVQFWHGSTSLSLASSFASYLWGLPSGVCLAATCLSFCIMGLRVILLSLWYVNDLSIDELWGGCWVSILAFALNSLDFG